MASRTSLVLLLSIVLCAAAPAPQSLKSEWNSLVETEQAFARLSTAKGTRDAFLANLNDASILFRPQAVPGKEWTEKSPPATSQLSWQPEFADIARSGDLGYTTGPWNIRRSPQQAPDGFGHYVTVWKKQTDGAWKIALDLGISHSAAAMPTRVASPNIGPAVEKRYPANEIEGARMALLNAEKAFPTTDERYLSRLAPDARLYRNGGLPVTGQDPIRRELAKAKGTFTWKIIGADVSGSVDLAYTYGTSEFRTADTTKTAESMNYLRIWKRETNGNWRVVLDLLS